MPKAAAAAAVPVPAAAAAAPAVAAATTKAAPAPGTFGIPLPAFGAVQQLGLPALPAMNLAVNPAMLASVAPPQPPKMVAVKQQSGKAAGPGSRVSMTEEAARQISEHLGG